MSSPSRDASKPLPFFDKVCLWQSFSSQPRDKDAKFWNAIGILYQGVLSNNANESYFSIVVLSILPIFTLISSKTNLYFKHEQVNLQLIKMWNRNKNLLRKGGCVQWINKHNFKFTLPICDCQKVLLRTFALIVSAHPYCSRNFTCHVMHWARALSIQMKNYRADDHCYSFAWI